MSSFFGDMCGNQVISETPSPDNKHKAVVFVRDCGATTGFSTQVSILKYDNKIRDDESGNILTTSDKYYGQRINNVGGPDVKIKWMTNRKVILLFDKNVDTVLAENEFNGIEITYDYSE